MDFAAGGLRQVARFSKIQLPLKKECSPVLFFGGSPSVPIPSGSNDFSLAKVERPKGDGKYRPFGLFVHDSSWQPSYFVTKMGIPTTLTENSLPYTFSFGTLIERAKKKSIPDKDMGIKKAHRLKNRTKE